MSGPEPELELIGVAPTRTFRCLWMLEELGVPYKHTPAIPQGDNTREVHPLGKVPALREGDFLMFESAAINTYLGDKFRGRPGAPTLVPEPGTHLRARYEQHIHFIQSEIDAQGLWIHMKHVNFAKAFGDIPAAVEVAKRQTEKATRALVKDLRQSGLYLLGSEFSAADIMFVFCLNWIQRIGWDDWIKEEEGEADVVHLHGYMARCREREAYARVLAIRERDMPLLKDVQVSRFSE